MINLTNVLTDKGNLKNAASRNIKSQASSYLESIGFEKMPNGKYAKVIAEADGKLITINLDMSIGLDTDFAAKENAPKAKASAQPIDVPTLF